MYRVLLVENDPLTRRLACSELECLPETKVDAAASALEAIDEAARNQYSLIMMSTELPGMDGLEATRQLRRRGCRAPIVGMSNSQRREACLAAGMNDFSRKPANYLSIADSWLTGHQQTAA